MKELSSRIRVFATVLVLATSLNAHQAHALDRDVRTVLIVGVYGIAAGSLLGALAFPATQDVKSIFIGSSVGLYLGLIVGIYHVNHRDDPQNPLVSSRSRLPIDIQNETRIGYNYTVARF